MVTVPTRSDPALVRLEIGPVGAAVQTQARVLAVAADGAERELAAWPVRERHGDVAMARSADGARVGVLVGDELRTIALADGATVDRATGAAIAAPVSGVATPANTAGAGEVRGDEVRGDEVRGDEVRGDAVLVWIDGIARVAWPEGPGPLHAPLSDGWSIALTGDAVVDPDQATGDGSSSLVFPLWPADPPHADGVPAVRPDRDELLRTVRTDAERRSRTPQAFRLVVRRAGRETVVHEEDRAPVEGVVRLHWPPVVTADGLLLRRSVSTSRPGGTDHEMQQPWLVTPGGEVRTLPFQLGVGPRATLPDGRLLLPNYDALWWDGSDEAPSALTLEGDTAPLRVGPAGRDDHARPHRLLRDAFEDLRPAWPPPPDDEGWHVVDVRVDAAADEVVVLLVEGFPESYPSPRPESPPEPGEGSTAWAVVAFGLGGDGPVRGIAHGARPAGAGTSFAL